jgi:hypothetical protein
MKKVNYEKLGKQFFSILCGTVLFGGVMLNVQKADAQILQQNEIISQPVLEYVGNRGKCRTKITYPDGTTMEGISKGNLVQKIKFKIMKKMTFRLSLFSFIILYPGFFLFRKLILNLFQMKLLNYQPWSVLEIKENVE